MKIQARSDSHFKNKFKKYTHSNTNLKNTHIQTYQLKKFYKHSV